MKKIIIAISGAVILLGGCTTSPLANDYGQSVREMNAKQVYDPKTLTTPSTAAVEGADPDLVNAAVQSMRKETTEREKVSQPLVINVGAR
jgi:outer membrane murein-binding lipoprotein Lpp